MPTRPQEAVLNPGLAEGIVVYGIAPILRQFPHRAPPVPASIEPPSLSILPAVIGLSLTSPAAARLPQALAPSQRQPGKRRLQELLEGHSLPSPSSRVKRLALSSLTVL
jgi:hypothetical protein